MLLCHERGAPNNSDRPQKHAAASTAVIAKQALSKLRRQTVPHSFADLPCPLARKRLGRAPGSPAAGHATAPPTARPRARPRPSAAPRLPPPPAVRAAAPPPTLPARRLPLPPLRSITSVLLSLALLECENNAVPHAPGMPQSVAPRPASSGSGSLALEPGACQPRKAGDSALGGNLLPTTKPAGLHCLLENKFMPR